MSVSGDIAAEMVALRERSPDDTHHFYGAWRGPRLRASPTASHLSALGQAAGVPVAVDEPNMDAQSAASIISAVADLRKRDPILGQAVEGVRFVDFENEEPYSFLRPIKPSNRASKRYKDSKELAINVNTGMFEPGNPWAVETYGNSLKAGKAVGDASTPDSVLRAMTAHEYGHIADRFYGGSGAYHNDDDVATHWGTAMRGIANLPGQSPYGAGREGGNVFVEPAAESWAAWALGMKTAPAQRVADFYSWLASHGQIKEGRSPDDHFYGAWKGPRHEVGLPVAGGHQLNDVQRGRLEMALARLPKSDLNLLASKGVTIQVENRTTGYPAQFDPETHTIRTSLEGTGALGHEVGHAMDWALGWPSHSEPWKYLVKQSKGARIAGLNHPYAVEMEAWADAYNAAFGGDHPMWLLANSPLIQVARDMPRTADMREARDDDKNHYYGAWMGPRVHSAITPNTVRQAVPKSAAPSTAAKPAAPELKPLPGQAAFAKTVDGWKTSEPWLASKADIIAGKVPGVKYLGDGGQADRVSHPFGGAVLGRADQTGAGGFGVTDKFFDQSPDMRKYLMYHEAGHQALVGFTWDFPQWTTTPGRFQLPWEHESHSVQEAFEVLADTWAGAMVYGNGLGEDISDAERAFVQQVVAYGGRRGFPTTPQFRRVYKGKGSESQWVPAT